MATLCGKKRITGQPLRGGSQILQPKRGDSKTLTAG